ncbi:hypothetical protein BDW75DRAFT_245446 [Aspergillus navahoensis]
MANYNADAPKVVMPCLTANMRTVVPSSPSVIAAAIWVSYDNYLSSEPNCVWRYYPEAVEILNATQAYNCLRSVPFNPAVATQLLQYLNDTIQFLSTLSYPKDPPPGYQQPPVDILAGLARIQHDINNGMFPNEHDFETALYRLFTAT